MEAVPASTWATMRRPLIIVEASWVLCLLCAVVAVATEAVTARTEATWRAFMVGGRRCDADRSRAGHGGAAEAAQAVSLRPFSIIPRVCRARTGGCSARRLRPPS